MGDDDVDNSGSNVYVSINNVYISMSLPLPLPIWISSEGPLYQDAGFVVSYPDNPLCLSRFTLQAHSQLIRLVNDGRSILPPVSALENWGWRRSGRRPWRLVSGSSSHKVRGKEDRQLREAIYDL
jgi:hypothetical protein